MNDLKPTGWHQLKTLLLTATTPAVPITVPNIAAYDTYCLVVSPDEDVFIVTEAGQVISAMVTLDDGTKIFGIFCSNVKLYAYSAVPEPITITPFADLYGEMTELPVTFPEVAGGPVLDYVPWSVYEETEVFYEVDHDGNLSVYRVQNVAATGSWNFTWRVPFDFDKLVALHCIFIAGNNAEGTGKDIDLESMYHHTGEVLNIHNEVDTTSTYTLPGLGVGGLLDVSSVYSSLSADDECGLNVDHNSIGGSLHYIGIILRYLRVHP